MFKLWCGLLVVLLSACESAPGLIAPPKHALFSPCPANAVAMTMVAPGNGTTDVPSNGATITVAVNETPGLPGGGTLVLSLLPLTLTPDVGPPVSTGILYPSSFARFTGAVPPLTPAMRYMVTSQNISETYSLGCFTTQP